MLNVWYLIRIGILDQPVLYLSQYINAFKTDYYRLLQQVTVNGNWEAWIIYILTAVKETAIETLRKINAIHDLLTDTVEKVRTDAPVVYSRELIDMLFVQPYCKISFLVEEAYFLNRKNIKYFL